MHAQHTASGGMKKGEGSGVCWPTKSKQRDNKVVLICHLLNLSSILTQLLYLCSTGRQSVIVPHQAAEPQQSLPLVFSHSQIPLAQPSPQRPFRDTAVAALGASANSEHANRTRAPRPPSSWLQLVLNDPPSADQSSLPRRRSLGQSHRQLGARHSLVPSVFFPIARWKI